MKRLAIVIFGALALSALQVTSAGAAQVVNGSFTDGLNGWQVQTEPGSGGDWVSYSANPLPISGHIGPVPLDGNAAVADETGETSTILYQEVALEPGFTHTLSLDYWVINEGGGWIAPDPNTFSYGTPNNQQARIDIIKSSAAADTTDPADILRTIYAPTSGDSLILDWSHSSVDLSPLAGQSVRIRFVDVNNAGYLQLGVDNVAITSVPQAAPDPGPPLLKIVSLSPSSFKASGKRGATLNYTLNRSAGVTVRTLQARSGRRSGTRCVRSSKQNSGAKKCTRWIKLAGLGRTDGKAGSNTFAFDGSPEGHALAPGRYRLLVAAYAPGYESAAPTATASFKIR